MFGPASAQGLEAGPAIVDGQGNGKQVAQFAIEIGGATLGMLEGADQDVGQSGGGRKGAGGARRFCRSRGRR